VGWLWTDLGKQAFVMELVEGLRKTGNWCGETHVQKTIFFTQLLSDQPPPFKFVLYKHGPFSFDLSETLSVMGALRYLEDEVPDPRYGPRLKPNSDAITLLRQKFGTLAVNRKAEIEFVVEKLSNYGVAMLERLGTALYFTKQEPIQESLLRAQKINEVKPHISQIEALKAIETVDSILSEWNQRTGKAENS
jgi:hypothetical protein